LSVSPEELAASIKDRTLLNRQLTARVAVTSEQMLIADRPIDESQPPIVVVLGATGSGKTTAAVEIPGAEVICVDRFPAFEELGLGVAKPTVAELAKMPHHLVNVFRLGELAGHAPKPGFVHLGGRGELPVLRGLAMKAIDNIAARNGIPVIVGRSASTLQEFTLGFVREEDSELKQWLDTASEKDLRLLCEQGGLPYFQYFNPLDAIRRKIYAHHTIVGQRPLPNVYPIGIQHDMYHLVNRARDRLDQMWDEGLPQEVERLVDTYGWVRPLAEAIGYKEFMPDSDGAIPDPDKVRRAILANTIGFIWSQSKAFEKMKPVHWASSPEHAAEIGRWAVEQYQTNGLQVARRFYYPYTLNGEPRRRLGPKTNAASL
jgi:tRNA dimethylallyltransferase